MDKKIIVSITLIFCISILFSGCFYPAYKDYYSDINNYEEIWELSGLSREYKNSIKLFPKDINSLNVTDCFCRYDQQLPLGEAFQVLLEIKYDESNEFKSEMNRILSCAFNCDEYFEDNGLSAYATLMKAESYYEYVLVNEETQTIFYIYLQNLPKEQIEIKSDLLPTQY